MKRFLILSIVCVLAVCLVAVSLPAQTKKEAFKYEDKIGVVKIKKGDPIHIASWMVVAGPDASLGTEDRKSVV